ncbi:MAG: FtsX-like permease family protein [Proteobacteria bacterium]|nr:FtsX-like permease family protein [Pseudomonadota bacterium]
MQSTVILAAGEKLATASLVGINPEEYAAVSDVGEFLLGALQTSRGSVKNPQTLRALHQQDFGIIIGRTLARRLGVGPGDRVIVMLAKPRVSIVGALSRQKRFTVLDTFNSGSQLDNEGAFISLGNAQRLLQLGERTNALHGRLVSLFDFAGARNYLSAQFTTVASIRSWMMTYGNLYQAIAVQKTMMYALFSLLIGVAAFNLISSLMMMVEHHRGDIAILRSMGATSGQIVSLFCGLGFLLGLGGITIGLCVGSLVAVGLESVFPIMQSLLGVDLMTQYFISYLPVEIRWMDVGVIFFGALTLSFVASVYPAWRAAKLLPSRVLAYE